LKLHTAQLQQLYPTGLTDDVPPISTTSGALKCLQLQQLNFKALTSLPDCILTALAPPSSGKQLYIEAAPTTDASGFNDEDVPVVGGSLTGVPHM
jgi:hypothetical protein